MWQNSLAIAIYLQQIDKIDDYKRKNKKNT